MLRLIPKGRVDLRGADYDIQGSLYKGNHPLIQFEASQRLTFGKVTVIHSIQAVPLV